MHALGFWCFSLCGAGSSAVSRLLWVVVYGLADQHIHFRALINQTKAAVEAAAPQPQHRGLASPEDCEIKKKGRAASRSYRLCVPISHVVNH